jgi:large subunit ribosomal protein L2
VNKYLINLKPTTPSQRMTCLINKRNLNNKFKFSNLLISFSNSSGRNNTGQITIRHRGNRSKNFYRKLDFYRNIINIPAKIISMEYDPYRSSFISLIYYLNGIFSYILSTQFNFQYYIYNNNNQTSFNNIGDCNILSTYTNGTLLHSIENKPGMGGKISRSAGTYSLLLNGNSIFTKIKIPSGKILLLSSYCKATLGIVSNKFYRNFILGKAGRSRWLGIRPHVRGVAMNPIDHPHGGGEGKKTGRATPFSVWGRRQKTKS